MSYKSNKSYTSLNSLNSLISLKSVDGRRSTVDKKNANKEMNARLAKKLPRSLHNVNEGQFFEA